MSYVIPPITREMIESQTQSRIAANSQRSAMAAESTKKRIKRLVTAMETQLELARASQETAERSEKFARRMAWWSLGVSIASAAAATAAVVISVATMS